MNQESYIELRSLDEEERLLWLKYAETKSPDVLEKIVRITERKDLIYRNAA